jgi:glutamate racemase
VNSKALKLPATEHHSQPSIGVFDSGIGGLSVLQALRAEMPQERFIYWSDSAFAPYGERSESFVIDRSHFITEQLIAKGKVKTVVVACNTATAVAIESLRQRFPELPFVGVEPALKPAVGLSQTGRVGVIGTHATLQSARFEKLLAKVKDDASSVACEFVIQPCKGLALAIEQQTEKVQTDTLELEQLCRQYLQEMGTFGNAPGQIDTLVLGCTHYVFAQDIFRQIVGAKVNIISTGLAVAKQAQRLSLKPTLGTPLEPVNDAAFVPNTQASDTLQLWTTGSLSSMVHAADRWLDLPPHHCHWIGPADH